VASAACFDEGAEHCQWQNLVSGFRTVVQHHRQIRSLRQRAQPLAIFVDQAADSPERKFKLNQSKRCLGPGANLVRRIVKVGDKTVKLSPKEYDLLRVLVQHAGKVLTHKFLLTELWGDLSDAQYLRVYVRQLRQKLEDNPEKPKYIHTETGIGYRLYAPDLS